MSRRATACRLMMIRADRSADIDVTLKRIRDALPQVSASSIETAMRQVDERLSYFRQLALILGAVSLVVGFLLVTTLVTVSVNERLGEIIVMRAIGVAKMRIVQQIVLEGIVIMVVGALAGLGLGLVTARYLNSILASFPGLPAAIDFFLFQPRRCLVRARHADRRRRARRDLSVVARRVAADRDDSARGSRRMTDPLLSARDLKREYHMGAELVRAVRGVSLDVAAGDYVAIVGPSGCGKSTLLNLIGGIDRPDEGAVTIDGRARRSIARQGCDALSSAEHRVRLSALLSDAGADGDRERRAADGRSEGADERAATSRAGSARLRRTRASGAVIVRRSCRAASSSAWRSRARWRTQPRILLADEPTGELDAKTGAEMIELLAQVNRDGTTILVVTHDENLARAARRVVHMRDGVIVDDRRQDARRR